MFLILVDRPSHGVLVNLCRCLTALRCFLKYNGVVMSKGIIGGQHSSRGVRVTEVRLERGRDGSVGGSMYRQSSSFGGAKHSVSVIGVDLS